MDNPEIKLVDNYEIGSQIDCSICGGYWQKGFNTETSWGFGDVTICTKCMPSVVKWIVEKFKEENKAEEECLHEWFIHSKDCTQCVKCGELKESE